MPATPLTPTSEKSWLDRTLSLCTDMRAGEKYTAIDSFLVRGGAVLSTAAVWLGATVVQLNLSRFATGSVTLTLVSMCVARINLKPSLSLSRLIFGRMAGAMAVVMLMGLAAPADAQNTREEQRAADQAKKASELHPYIKVQLSSVGGSHPSWKTPVDAYFRLLDGAWRLVGFERMPDA